MSSSRIVTIINKLLESLYSPFRRFLPYQTFKYAATGGSNTAFDILLYAFAYNFILKKQVLDIGFFAFKPHIAAFIMSFSVTFPTGFFLAKYITFTGSDLRGRIQFLRYGMTVLGSILLNYLFLKLFVEYFHLYPTFSKILTTGIVVIFSYLSQKHFSFKQTQRII